MDEDWGEDSTTTQFDNKDGSSFSRGRGYTATTDDGWESSNGVNGFGDAPRRGGGRGGRGGRGGGRGGGGRGGGGFGGRNFEDAVEDNAFESNGGGGGGWGNDDEGEGGFGSGGGGGRGRGRGRGSGERRGRGRGGRGGGSGGGGGDGFGDDGDFGSGGGDGGDGEEKKPPRSTYIPEEANDTDLMNTGISSGINFGKYKDIPVNTSGDNVPPPIMSFEEASFRPVVMENIAKAKYSMLTPIQQYSIPIITAGRDLMACAQTGSGKTAAFLLPIINFLLANPSDIIAEGNFISPQCVIISPTRELTTQIYEQARRFAYTSVIKVCQVYGGTQVYHQRNKLLGGCHILVATPGRLLAFVRDRLIDFSATRFIVLDEADRMLDMGFLPDVQTVMSHESMPPMAERQTLMYSATFPEEVQTCAGKYLHNYIFVSVGIVGGACSDIEQVILEVDKFRKREKLLEILRDEGTTGTVVFVETKRNADFLAVCLSEQQLPTTSIHGDRLQQEREAALRDFKTGQKQILVATEVAARGLDIENIRHVINYDMPKDISQYVHRIGRTGRVGNRGKATTFFNPSHDGAVASALARVLKTAGQPVPDFLSSTTFGGSSYGGGSNAFGGTDIRDGFGEATQQNEPEEEW